MEDSYKERLEAAKRGSVGQLLFRCARLFNEKGLSRLRERTGQKGLRETHTRLFPHIDLEGTRVTELASRLGVSKQAASQWVEELIAMGMVERVRDPDDGRARLIRYSQEGREGLLDGLAMLGELEEELEEQIGAEDQAALHRILLAMSDWLDRDAEAQGGLKKKR